MKRCACEDGWTRCDHTTVCALNNAVEEKVNEIYWDINSMGGRATDERSRIQMEYLDEILEVLEKHR